MRGPRITDYGLPALDPFIYKQVDYIMGANNAKQSFIVGFCSGCLKQASFPHHRNVYLRDDNPDDSAKQYMTIPERNQQFGYMVGGSWNSSDYKDDVTLYSVTEGGIDYNAGLVGALGYIVSRLDPADTSVLIGVDHRRGGPQPHRVDFLTLQQTTAGWLLKTSGQMRITTVSVYDCHGRLIFAARPDASTLRCCQSLRRGVYMVRMQTGDNHCTISSLCVVR